MGTAEHSKEGTTSWTAKIMPSLKAQKEHTIVKKKEIIGVDIERKTRDEFWQVDKRLNTLKCVCVDTSVSRKQCITTKDHTGIDCSDDARKCHYGTLKIIKVSCQLC
jgi:hypothetical protein